MKRNYLWLVVVLVFWAAVSVGGCGGSSSNSSDDSESSNAYMAPLPESVDIDPTTESGDYGDGFEVVNDLSLLNGTKWKVNKVLVHSVSANGASRKLQVGEYNFYYDTTWSLMTTDDSFMLFNENSRSYSYEPLKTSFYDEGLYKLAVIILPASGFVKPTYKQSAYNYESYVNRDGVMTEAIQIIGRYPNYKELWITCLLQATDSSNNHYQSWVHLIQAY